MKALTVKQPWASLIVEGIKDIENRTWKCPQKYIGKRVLVHASMGLPMYMSGYYNRYLTIEQNDVAKKKMGVDYFHLELQTSAIIGSVEIMDCVINHQSIWAEKTHGYRPGVNLKLMSKIYGTPTIYNWVLANPIKFEKPIPCKGKLSFWDFDINE